MSKDISIKIKLLISVIGAILTVALITQIQSIYSLKAEAEEILQVARRALRDIENDLASRIGRKKVEHLRAALELDWGVPSGRVR